MANRSCGQKLNILFKLLTTAQKSAKYSPVQGMNGELTHKLKLV